MKHLRLLLFFTLSISLFTSTVPAQKKAVTLQASFSSREFSGGRVNVRWMNDGEHFSIVKLDKGTKAKNIWKVNARTNDTTMLVDLSTLSDPSTSNAFMWQNYSFSENEMHLIFTISQKQIWRRSMTGEYAVYDITAKKLIPLPQHASGLRNVKVSPDGKWVGYVFEDNIYIYNLVDGNELQLTNDAEENVYNGRFGWVYEEEFSIVDGWQWSPDSKHIAFWHEDERNVPEYTMTDWTPLHLELIPIRYPKPGDANPIEKIGVIDITSQKTTWMDLGSDSDIYIPRIYWTNQTNVLCIQRLNRLQNHLELLFGDVKSGKSRVVLEENSTTGWIEIDDGVEMKFLKNSKRFIWASERDGWRHLYLYDTNGNLINQITKGEWEVSSLEGISADEKYVYYSSPEETPLERQLYRIRLDGSGKDQLSNEQGSHSISMSPTCAMYIDSWSSTKQPQRSVLYDADGDEIRSMAEVKKEVFDNWLWSPKEIMRFTTSDGLELYLSMIKPPNFDPSKKYPVYFDVYGGPNYQNVFNTWPRSTHEWIANEGFIVVQVDNRGGGGRGTAFKHWVYRQLGKWEAHDYVEAAKHISTLPYVDKNTMGIWGWSYGGYMSALTMLLGAEYFKAGVAIAPVTDWKFYDTIYAERYMQRPEDNPDGYKVGSCVEHADKLKGKLLLIQGGNDDNVHLQNTMQFIDKLEAEGKQFDMRIYPNGNHGVASGMNSYIGLYEYFMDFMKRNLMN